MDKEKDILKDFFKGKLQDYEPPVKRDLWSSLESHIPAEKSLWRRIYPAVASAAAVLLILILTYRYIYNDSPDTVASVIESPQNIQEEFPTESDVLVQNEGEISENSLVPESGIKQETLVAVAVTKNTKSESASESKTTDVLVVEADNNAEIVSGDEEKQDMIVSETLTKQEQSAEEPIDNATTYPQNDNWKNDFGNNSRYYTQIRSKGNSGFKMQVSLSGKGFPTMSNDLDYFKIYNSEYLTSYDNKFQIDELFPGSSPTGGDETWHPDFPADNYTLMNIKYHTPVTLSIHVSKNISSRWAIETGISYTKLSSEEIWEAELSNNTDLLTSNVKLDYLGIPLRASYFLIQNNHFFVYVAGGGMIEKCISGKAFTVTKNAGKEKNTNLKISELQYSVTGGLGLGLLLFKPVSLFVEPGVVYYFDDGSDIMTIRKDKPFSYNIQGGLRIGF